MAVKTHSYKTDTDVVKTEARNRASRDEATLASGSGIVIAGTVLGTVTVGGKKKPLAPGASDGSQIATDISLQHADATSKDVRIVTLARGVAEVVLQALVWPAGISATQKAAALAQLETKLITARNGV
ncbi:head decoration protein [Tianweitania sp. BSSL-BM11]|uniref:Head decoration protein n=1 Tax=Tianweitania aestuarii TaxID=2814886 RepID=A0ABS5RT02_9HYPH|nr:head decoration protein [Tianweitania aestuarii]MBS9720183.1 head decoration protein [Tianweitania aestuarii]